MEIILKDQQNKFSNSILGIEKSMKSMTDY